MKKLMAVSLALVVVFVLAFGLALQTAPAGVAVLIGGPQPNVGWNGRVAIDTMPRMAVLQIRPMIGWNT